MLRSPVSPINPAAPAVTHKDMQQTANHTPAPPPAPHAGHAPVLMALLVFVLTLLVTFGAWSSAQRSAEAQLHEAFDYRTRDMGYAIGRRLLVYEQVLRGARGYLRGSVDLSRAEFAEYYEVLRLDQSFPGLEALAIASAIPPGALAAAFRFEATDSSVEALAVRYPNERFARPHVSDVRTPDPGGSKVARKVVQNGSLVVEVRGADPAAVARFASAVATGLGVAPEPPAAGSGSGSGAVAR